ncbi:hypothetical protein LGQ03_14880 [Loktanella sp. TSTF-M6]|uniref:Uncharacterized protein n=1 Tax=Loktanella gaetbuli TaxID=2881335 RepID=A0ABS8BXW6_9RHOB|nr:hypothetical protein [Loktanella gaetbuli]MCB5200524.1 hypothetical protein [Loktanella gaetbuli]
MFSKSKIHDPEPSADNSPIVGAGVMRASIPEEDIRHDNVNGPVAIPPAAQSSTPEPDANEEVATPDLPQVNGSTSQSGKPAMDAEDLGGADVDSVDPPAPAADSVDDPLPPPDAPQQDDADDFGSADQVAEEPVFVTSALAPDETAAGAYLAD